MKELVLLLPEIFLVLTLAGIVAGEIAQRGERFRLYRGTALVGLGGAFVQTLISYQYGASQILGHALTIDGLSLIFKLFFIALAAIATIASPSTREIGQERRSEYCAIVIAATLAMCLAASAADLLLVFLLLQLMNTLIYFLAAYGKNSALSTEASLKYLAFGAVSGALLLYGTALLFTTTHAINMYEMHQALAHTPLSRETALVSFMLIFLALAFQMAAFPMHLWAPDVLEGSPTPVSAFISLGSRAAGFAIALRLFLVVFAQPTETPGQWKAIGDLDWPMILAVVSGITMLLGSLLAFRQQGAKRLISYLVVAETGYLLMGLLVLDEVGLAAILYSLTVELFAVMGAFYVLAFLIDETRSDRLSDLQGVLGRAVPECIALVLFLVCLCGLPPLPGFIGKFALIGSAIRHQWSFLALVAVISSAISTAAVARLAYSLVGDFSKTAKLGELYSRSRRIVVAALFVPMILVGLFADRVLMLAGQSLRFILW